jgi:phosphatidylserine decarboxylase
MPPGTDVVLENKPAPVQQIITLDTELGEIKLRLITSYFASRLKVWVRIGQALEMGDKVGRIMLGSTVAVQLPGRLEFSVKPPQRVVGGETIIHRKEVGR